MSWIQTLDRIPLSNAICFIYIPRKYLFQFTLRSDPKDNLYWGKPTLTLNKCHPSSITEHCCRTLICPEAMFHELIYCINSKFHQIVSFAKIMLPILFYCPYNQEIANPHNQIKSKQRSCPHNFPSSHWQTVKLWLALIFELHSIHTHCALLWFNK